MSQENVETVQRAFAAYNHRDVEGALEEWAPRRRLGLVQRPRIRCARLSGDASEIGRSGKSA